MNGASDGPPTKLPVALMDVLAAHQLKEGLLVALINRERGGDGTYVPVSLFQAAVSGLANQATNWLVAGHSPQRMGSAHPNIAPYGTPYPTVDGPPLVLAVGTDRQFAALCDVIDRSDLVDDSRFETNAQRVEHREALDRVLEERFAHFDTDSLLDALHERNVPAGIVRDVPAVFEQPTAQRMIINAESSPAGLRQTAFPHPDGDLPSLLPPPHYAEHTTHILRDRLGHSPEKIKSLRDDGVIAGA
jgi:crotonobetainyl-CoA:carnitine CoA-transferase CaiB-like acyl-CoA transferase